MTKTNINQVDHDMSHVEMIGDDDAKVNVHIDIDCNEAKSDSDDILCDDDDNQENDVNVLPVDDDINIGKDSEKNDRSVHFNIHDTMNHNDNDNLQREMAMNDAPSTLSRIQSEGTIRKSITEQTQIQNDNNSIVW